MSMIKSAVMGLMLASTVFAVGCNKADAEDATKTTGEATTVTAPVQAQAQTTVSATPAAVNASTTVKASLGTTQYFNNGYNSRAAYDRGLRNGERLEAERLRNREQISYRPRPVVIDRPVVVERPIERPVIVNRPVVIERPGFFVRFANWRHNHGCKF